RWPSAAAMLAAIQALLPDGLALREEMLASIPPEARVAVTSTRPPVDGTELPPSPAAHDGRDTPPSTPWRRPARIAALVVAAGAALTAALSFASRRHEPRAHDAVAPATAPAPSASTSPSPHVASASSAAAPGSADPTPSAPSAVSVASSHAPPGP